MQFLDDVLYLAQHDTLVVSDLQLGQEEELRSKGHLVLDKDLKNIKRKLHRAFKATGASRLVINGDLKHEFARINKQEWAAITSLLDFFSDKEIVLVKGNHDNMLEPILQEQGLELHEEFQLGTYLFVHGHERPTHMNFDTLIIGHEHPALRLSDGVRSESVKCFLVNEWKGKEVVYLPSFNELAVGVDILTNTGLGPFGDFSDAQVYACLQPTQYVGTVAELQRLRPQEE